jgi:hypothetical protein
METKFKTFITPNGEYGIIDISNAEGSYIIIFYTGSKPELYSSSTTIDELKHYYRGDDIIFMETNKNDDEKWEYVSFDWDEHFPKDWKLVEIELTIK